MRMMIALGLMLGAPMAAMAQGTSPERTNPSPNDPSIGAPAAPSATGNPAASTTTSMPAETGGGTVPGSGTDDAKTSGPAGKK